MFETPSHLVARKRAVAEFLLGYADRFDIEDPVNDPEIVIDAADAIFVFQIALAGTVHCLDDLLQYRVLRAGRLRRDRDVTLGGVTSGNDIFFRIRPDVSNYMIGRESQLLRRLESDRIHHTPAAKHYVIAFRATDGQPLRLLLVAWMRHLDLLDDESIFLREQLVDRNRLFAIRGAVVKHDDFLALEPVEAADFG